jgi:hypothetical protein
MILPACLSSVCLDGSLNLPFVRLNIFRSTVFAKFVKPRRDVHETFQPETETFSPDAETETETLTKLSETRPRRDLG